MDINEEWENFISDDYNKYDDDNEDTIEEINEILDDSIENFVSSNISEEFNLEIPKATKIYISTKTKLAYLTTTIDLKEIFWKIPVIPYSKPVNGVIKKQMKFNSVLKEDYEYIKNKLTSIPYYEENVITHIDNPNGRIKFKDIRKVSIGISKKDIMSYRSKKKSAFYNCFVLILRMKIDDTFKEFHVKVFNTGKLEIPGVQSEAIFELILNQVIETLQPYLSIPLGYKENTNETVLINSNFNCGFYVNREVLYDILKDKYNLQAIYDPCSYPGIQCKFYYNPEIGIQNGCQISDENKHLYNNISEVSFMIFRTGSVLIVGKCDENVLHIIYDFLKNILCTEYKSICQRNLQEQKDNALLKDKKKKIRKKNVIIEMNV
jgi:hypothetical protein